MPKLKVLLARKNANVPSTTSLKTYMYHLIRTQKGANCCLTLIEMVYIECVITVVYSITEGYDSACGAMPFLLGFS